QFLADHYLRAPYAAAQGARRHVGLLSWPLLWRLLPRGPAAELLVVRDGMLWRGPDPDSAARGAELFAAGWSLVLRHAERQDPGLAALAAEFEAELAAPVAIQLYATPGGRHSFGWHYDAEEVFIVQ